MSIENIKPGQRVVITTDAYDQTARDLPKGRITGVFTHVSGLGLYRVRLDEPVGPAALFNFEDREYGFGWKQLELEPVS